ncbi:MAG: tRNA-(ms[2]io[6]A)-hydroxylase [Deltaproteobacteria bacterium]|nr:MAG: tRNA-(ms[2]io[6]A)-hydroxylase [Deltaproteobacteria bacterium]
MLHLAAPTRPGWLPHALLYTEEILIDHAHCEKKAASTALNLIFRYVDQPDLVGTLSALAREELEHFERVLSWLSARGIALRRLRPAPYAARLHAAVRKPEPHRLLDTLLVCALIEARSCERMRLLADALPDPELAAAYRALLADEARHFTTYVDLARRRFGGDVTDTRLAVLAEHEARCLAEPFAEPRLHG